MCSDRVPPFVSCCCCPWPCPAALYCARARLQDGQAILELGCGWGSLTLFMAQAYPRSSITAVSNSSTQREFIMRRARDLDLTNVQVLTADMVEFQVHKISTGCGINATYCYGAIVQYVGWGLIISAYRTTMCLGNSWLPHQLTAVLSV